MQTNLLKLKYFMTASALTILAGCAVPNLGEAPRIAETASFASKSSFAGMKVEWPKDQWWTVYGDAQLSALIDEALADSPSLDAAAARLRRADALAAQSNAARVPTVSSHSAVNFSREDLSVEAPDSLSAVFPEGWSTRSNSQTRIEYQLDFFGKNRAAFEAATSRTDVAAAELAAARLELSTAVASAYADFARLTADRGAAAETVRVREESAGLSRQRFDRGLEDEGQTKQSESQLAQARASLISLDGQLELARHQIAALLGKGPDRGLTLSAPAISGRAIGVPETAGIDLMGRRPDLTAARLRAEAAGHQIDVARADFYPNVTLSAVGGMQTLGIDRLGGGTLLFGQVGPAVSLPIFDGGRRKGTYRQSRADYDEAVALYNKAVVGALREVADAVSDQRSLDAQIRETRLAHEAAQTSYRLARQRYQGGLSSYVDLLVVENSLITTRQNLARLETRAFALDVAMVRALGGGFVAS